MTAQHWHSVASGKPYLITVPPVEDNSSLDGFLGDVEFGIDSGGDPLLIRGHGIRHGDVVRFQEKDAVGGKDVRVWHISQRSGGFVAESIAAF